MNINAIIGLALVFAIPSAGIIGTWAVMKYRLNNHSKRINDKADKELVDTQFKAVNSILCTIQKDIRELVHRKRKGRRDD